MIDLERTLTGFAARLLIHDGEGDAGAGAGAGGDAGSTGGDAGKAGGAGGAADKTYSSDYVNRLRAELENVRKDSTSTAKERDELRQKIADAEKAELEKKGELQKLLDKERKEREDERKQTAEKLSASDRRYIIAEAKSLALKAGIIDPDDVKAAIDVADLRIDDDGNVPGLEDKVAKLKESKPHWFGKAGADNGGNDGGKGDSNGSGRKVPPQRKDGDANGNKGPDWKAKSDAEFAKEFESQFGVAI